MNVSNHLKLLFLMQVVASTTSTLTPVLKPCEQIYPQWLCIFSHSKGTSLSKRLANSLDLNPPKPQSPSAPYLPWSSWLSSRIPRGSGSLHPRTSGPMLNWEQSEWFQQMSQYCIDSKPERYSAESLLCSGVIDFGITLLRTGYDLRDTLTCFVLNIFVGSEWPCLTWTLVRFLLPDLDESLIYLNQRGLADSPK